jgi:tetratricopeptide (TPR) repeat protein
MAYDCFLSYHHADRAHAQVLYERLTAEGFSVWFDQMRLRAPVRWHEEIERHSEESRVVLAVLTPRWKLSWWTRFETYGAAQVIPVLVEDAWEQAQTPPLSRWQFIDLREEGWDRLVARLREHLATPVKQPERVVLLPYHHTPHFVGREEELASIHEKLYKQHTAALTQGHIEAITALGGVGKTTLAREYAERFWRCYRRVFWVDCRVAMTSGFARIHDALRPGQAELPDPDKAQWALRELSRNESPLTLLVLDNAEDEESVLAWIPNTGKCHTLITSRFTAWSQSIETTPVWVLQPGPARELLLRVSGQTDADAADAVAEKLEYLPLALQQAAAYVRQQPGGFGFRGYLELYERHERELLDERSPGATEYPHSVYLTWRATVEKLPPGARALLRLHAFLAPTPFPVSVYVAGCSVVAAEAGLAEAGEVELRKWIAALAAYSMIQLAPTGDAFSLHALVGAVERHAMPDFAATADRTVKLTLDHAPMPSWEPESRTLWRMLAGHTEALVEHLPLRGTQDAALLLHRASEAYRHRGDFRGAIPPAQRCLELYERVLGPEHPDTLISVNNLAGLYYHQGRYAEAEPLYERALRDRERVLGPEHPDTLSSVNNLALLYNNQGRYAEAEPLYVQGLRDRERVLGPEHPDTLSSVNNLAALYYSQGRYAEAEPLYERALGACERVLGPEHPSTLSSVNNLAELYRSQGRYAEAEPLYARAADGFRRVLGAEHPHTMLVEANYRHFRNRQ